MGRRRSMTYYEFCKITEEINGVIESWLCQIINDIKNVEWVPEA